MNFLFIIIDCSFVSYCRNDHFSKNYFLYKGCAYSLPIERKLILSYYYLKIELLSYYHNKIPYELIKSSLPRFPYNIKCIISTWYD